MFYLYVYGGCLECAYSCVYTCVGICVEPTNLHQVSSLITFHLNFWTRVSWLVSLVWVASIQEPLLAASPMQKLLLHATKSIYFSQCWRSNLISPSLPSKDFNSSDILPATKWFYSKNHVYTFIKTYLTKNQSWHFFL